MGRDDVSVRIPLRIAQIITDYHIEFKQKSVEFVSSVVINRNRLMQAFNPLKIGI